MEWFGWVEWVGKVEVGFDDFLEVRADSSVLELDGGVSVTSFTVGEFEDEVVVYEFVEFFLCDVEVFTNGGGGVYRLPMMSRALILLSSSL